MKKQFLATLVLVISAFATAHAHSTGETDCSSSKNITVHSSFTKLVVDGNVDVVIYEDNSTTEIRTFGNKADIASTVIDQKDGVLSIKNKNAKGQKVLVYVPVSNLRVIEANGNSKVSSATILNSELLTLVVKGECRFDIQSLGQIEVEQNDDVETVVEKKVFTARPSVQS